MNTPDKYRSVVRQLLQIVAEGTFKIVLADIPLEDLLQEPIPEAFIRHDFECTTCGTKFALMADTYHGVVRWMPDSGSYPGLNR